MTDAAIDAVPPELRTAIGEAQVVCKHYMAWTTFMLLNSSRDESFRDHDLMVPAMQYVTESAVMIPFLIENGAHRICIRELRFLVDVSLKLCLTSQASDEVLVDKTREGRFAFVREHLDRTAFSREIKRVRPALLHDLGDEFIRFAGSLYDDASGYVHLSAASLEEAARIELGQESLADIHALKELLERGFTVSIVLLCHAVQEWVVGDYCVNSDGSAVNSHFMASKFLARVDEGFDYKLERQANVEAIKRERATKIRF